MQTLTDAPNLLIQAAKYIPLSLLLSQFLTAPPQTPVLDASTKKMRGVQRANRELCPMVQQETAEAQYQQAPKSWGSTTGWKRSSCPC